MDLETLRQQISIVEVAQSMTTVKQTGSSGLWRGECPCCGGAGKAPFQVDTRPKGRGPHFHCYACGANGDVINLWALKNHGSLMVGRAEFPNVVRSLAQHFQIALPTDSARPKRSAEDQLREAVHETWQTAHTWMKNRLAEVRSTSDTTARSTMPLGYLDNSLNAHLTALGISNQVRERARLDEPTLATMAEGNVILRFHAPEPVGLSQPSPTNDIWKHLLATGVTPDLAFLTPLPRGRITDRHFVVTTDLEAAERIITALKTVGSTSDHASAKQSRHIGVLMWDHHDLTDLSSIKSVTVRALIVAAPVGSEQRWSRAAEQITRHGLGVRIAAVRTDADAGALVNTITTAPDYISWQLTVARFGDMNSPTFDLNTTFAKRVRPVIETISDPIARTVLASRVKALASLR